MDLFLDASVLLNLCATRRVEEILRPLPYRIMVGTRSESESLFLRAPGTLQRVSVDLEPLFAAGTLFRACLSSTEEEELFLSYASTLDDGEAEACALAEAREGAVASDDRRVNSILQRRGAKTPLLRTPEILHSWNTAAAPPPAVLAKTLQLIEISSRYFPGTNDSLFGWWNEHRSVE